MKKRLRIAQIAPPFLSVPSKTYGGTESVISNITEELVQRGHEVTLFASGDSITAAKLVSPFPQAISYEQIDSLLSPLAQNIHWLYSLPFFFHTVAAFEAANRFDIIHDHTHYGACFFAPFVKTPVILTYHGSFSLAEKSPIENMLLNKYSNLHWTAISDSQKNESKININFERTVYHGLHISNFPYTEKSKNYLLWLGRITDRKGTKEAILVAQKTGLKLILAGNVKDRDTAYFQKEIKPHIDNDLITYVGPVTPKEKITLLKQAKVLLYPVKWHEPFGLVMIESMAVGTPVIGFRNGSVPEIIVQNETGFVVDTLEELIAQTKLVFSLEKKKYQQLRKACRKRVETYFSVEKMVDQYESLYFDLLKK